MPLWKSKRRKRRQIIRDMPSEIQILEGVAETAVKIEAAEGADGEESKVRRFTMTAYTGGKLSVNGFAFPVVVDLAGMKVSAKSRPILRDHDTTQIIGHSDRVTINAGSIKVSGFVSGSGDAAQEVTASADNGFPWQASIGAPVERAVFVDEGETVKLNGRTFSGPIIVARKTRLSEISFTVLGADDNTSARIAASSAGHKLKVNDMEFEKWLEAKGFNPDEINDEQRKTLQAAFDTENVNPDDDPPADPPAKPPVQAKDDGQDPPAGDEDHIKARREAEAAEVERVDQIKTICAKYENPKIKVNGQEKSIEAMAIREGWSIDKTELEAMRESRPNAPAGHSRSHDRDCTLQAMQGAMILRAAGDLDADCYQTPQALAMGVPRWLRLGINEDDRQRAMEWAHRYSDMSMVDVCAQALRLAGQDVPHTRSEMIRAAISTGTLDDVYTTSVNARVLQTYMESGDTTRGWTREREVADFRPNQRPRMTKGFGLKKLARGGEAEHGTRSDVGESYKINRYAEQMGVDEQDMIDDRFDALSDTPVEMGMAAARLRPDLVYAILLANAALSDGFNLFDSANHGNDETVAALAAATLKTAIKNIEVQQESGVNLNLRASHLIVPSELKHTGAELIRSATIVLAGNTDTERGIQNTLATVENLELVSDSRLDNGVTDPESGTVHAGSGTTWYVGSRMAHTIEVGFLRGTGRAPTVRSFRFTEGKWGMGWDVKMDVGAKALDFRGFNRSVA